MVILKKDEHCSPYVQVFGTLVNIWSRFRCNHLTWDESQKRAPESVLWNGVGPAVQFVVPASWRCEPVQFCSEV